MTSAPPIHIRPRRDGDAQALLQALADSHARDRYPLRPGSVRWSWITEPAGGPNWVAEAHGRAVGHLALTADGPAVSGDALSVTRFFVASSARGTGSGSALLATAETYARETGVPLVLDVLDGSDAAIRLYEKRGWTRVDTIRADWTGPDGTHPLLHLYRAP
ncbi:acetyltransferase (GNAT) family protein [Diaminobutyricimonas aerilata]|uniref:Acetyltransferase (GNAT) family protein n=1 Tax=Diaminobutyricimonas aerilata TaxID=1162967 RepID=A0A2M9CHJ4_9MICO|nr:GNAT family N-acetyltransferase [Diaminobutyricimonas aerilata]PJJ71384.1 acetyltransferase (GNAT) family protein [Diaminobutyricimonas aerilata]